MSVDADLHDLRSSAAEPAPALDSDSYAASQALATSLRSAGSDGIIYPSIRHAGGECIALFYPDCASDPVQRRHLDYYWNGEHVDLVRDAGSGAVYRVVDLPADPA
jgi:hypothetical protein